MNLALRISIFFLLLTGGGFYYFVRTEVEETKQRYREATEEPLVDFSYLLASIVAEQVGPEGINIPMLRQAIDRATELELNADIYNFNKTQVDLRVYITDERGVVIFDSDNGRDEGEDYSKWRDVSLALRGEYGARTSRDDPSRKGSIMYVAAPIRNGDRIIGSLTVAKPNETANLFIAAAEKSTWYLGTVVFLSVGLLAVILSVYITRPLNALTSYVRDVRDGLRATLPSLTSGEMETLGAAFEEMRESLEGKQYVEQYVQALTHELKSPLTAIRGAAEILRGELAPSDKQKFLEIIEKESQRIQQSADMLLSLSALQRKQRLENRESFDVVALLKEEMGNLSPLIECRGITFSYSGVEHCLVSGVRFWVSEALRNLLRNAAEFSPPNSNIKVTTSLSNGDIRLTVRDHGAGIPMWALERVFEKFFSLPRPDTEKRSSGLGLAIVKEVAALHHGEASLENAPGGGAIAALTLPRE